MSQGNNGNYIEGQYLIAMPTMEDGRFAQAVIYVCAHSQEGAMGIVLNQPVANVTFGQLLHQLEIIPDDTAGFPSDKIRQMQVHRGGPVDAGRGFVLHTDDYFINDGSVRIENGVCLTATIEILRAIAEGRGPAKALLALGYAGWAPGQLEAEIHANGWLTCQAGSSLIFSDPPEGKWLKALNVLGIDPGMLSSEAGHA